jgi:predicted nucleic acid-binding protein
VASLVDANVLVYCFDPRSRRKQRTAIEILDEGLRNGDLRLPHQALVEFVSAVTWARSGFKPLLSESDARREAEEFLIAFEVLYPNDALFRTALRGAAAYQLSWFDAHMWAYAEHFGLDEIISEDFENGRLYGSVRVRNPFIT